MTQNSLSSKENFLPEDIQQATIVSSEIKDQKDQINLKTLSSTKINEKQQTAVQSIQSESSRLEDKSFSFHRRLRMQNTFRAERVRDQFKSLDVKKIAEQYTRQNVKVSSLSIPEYIEVVNESAQSKIEPIHFLPPIISTKLNQFSLKRDNYNNGNLNGNNQLNDRDFSNFGRKNNSSNFVNDDEIKYIHSNIVDFLDTSLQMSKQNWNQYKNSLFNKKNKSRSLQPSPQANKNNQSRNIMLNSFTTQLAKKQILQLQLQHNKNQFEQAKQYNMSAIKERFNTDIQVAQQHKKKLESQPKIISYPSRGRILENMMHIQIVKQIHEMSGNDLSTTILQNNNDNKDQLFKNEPKLSMMKVQYKGFWLDNEQKGWKPPARETTSCTQYGEKCYLYGGLGMEVLNDLCLFNIQQNEWQPLQQRGEYPKDGRFGHSLDIYKKQLIMFGGEKKCAPTSKLKELVNEVRVMNLETLEWKILRNSGDMIESRRDHVSSVVGKNLLIHGGISQKSYCNDMFHLDLQHNRWQEASCINLQKIFPEGIAHHKAIPIYFFERKNIQLYKSLEDKNADKLSRIKEEGVYFFGGVNQSGVTNNRLAILKTDSKPMYFIIPETFGEPPKPRCKHSMVYQEQMEWIIIYGGINENSNYGYLNDMYMLKLDTLIWREITFYGQNSIGRCGHLSLQYGSTVLIFGGLGDNGIYSLNARIVELDQKNVLRYAQDEIKMVELKNKKRANQFVDKNLQGNIVKIKQDLSQTEQAMQLQIQILENHKESVAKLMKKLQFKSQNQFLPAPNAISDISHVTNLLIYQNTEQNEEKIKKKELINQQAEKFNESDDHLNETLKNTQDNFFRKESQRSPSSHISNFRKKVKTLITVSKLNKQNSGNNFLDSPLTNKSSQSLNSKQQDQSSLFDQHSSGQQSPLSSLFRNSANFSQKAQDAIKKTLSKTKIRRSQTILPKDFAS
ncbi:kelch motif protein (macronuclear) [Tetrahymena thermophila SB210]|uniref:Kelch motif protein n=1 Tax=Tetrahymena thermophila (strain SB210) TaxID=312017 RepID=I7MDS0_TETTS|nr:kelch motif protein [Tetrahymena thermophila SB210]EAR90836.2 kelch motif protein [Tetrahymena thermophila SB210]|eukprot:XP_001011081.2 kelch motif protein [Tetrahymena thermophila SB210]